MGKKVGIIGGGESLLRKRVSSAPNPEVIAVVAPLPLFKELSIGQKFKYKNGQYKKVSSFTGYRNKVGLYSFGANTPVEKIIN